MTEASDHEPVEGVAVAAIPEPGQLVEVRRRPWVVQDVNVSGVPGDPLSPLGQAVARYHLVTLSSVEDDALGDELRVVWEIELGVRIFEGWRLPEPTEGFDEPRRFDAFLDAVRWGAIQMPRVNLLVADEVGCGKTIEADLVVQELILCQRAHTVLIACPSALQIQWRDQMRDKFGLEFRIVDAASMKELRRSRGLHVNPWIR